MKRNGLLGAAAFVGLATLTACGGGQTPAEEAAE